MARPNQSSPLDEQTLLRLQGGVKGRFARSFSVLQGNVDTLERYLRRHTNGAMQDDTEPLFESIYAQIGELEHLSANAVDLLNGTVLHDPQQLRPMDVADYLRAFCAGTNEELACRGAEARITLDLPAGQGLYLPASEALLNALFVNLITNSVRARHDIAITLECGAENVLTYRDTGPGPAPELLDILRGGAVSLTLLHRGGMGLLVAAVCAQDLGWQLEPDAAAGGFALGMRLPQAQPAPAVLCSDAGHKALQDRLRRLLRRELAHALRG